MSRAFVIAALMLATPAFAETRYFAEIPDLPLPPGFTQQGTAISFENGEGRIISVAAEGGGEMLAVRDFYYDTLPQLGWGESVEGSAAVFVRGRERLTFFIERDGDRIKLRAQLIIGAASMAPD
jgi:hypothetical protein